MGVGDIEELFPEGAGLVHNGVPFLGAVGDGKQADAGSGKILHGLNGVVNSYLRQKAGAGVKNMNFFGHNIKCC